MVYSVNPIKLNDMGALGGTPIFGNLHVFSQTQLPSAMFHQTHHMHRVGLGEILEAALRVTGGNGNGNGNG